MVHLNVYIYVHVLARLRRRICSFFCVQGLSVFVAYSFWCLSLPRDVNLHMPIGGARRDMSLALSYATQVRGMPVHVLGVGLRVLF